jgi:hypothetical protein
MIIQMPDMHHFTDDPAFAGKKIRRGEFRTFVGLVNDAYDISGEAPRTWRANLEAALGTQATPTEVLQCNYSPTFNTIKELWVKAQYCRGQLDAYRETPDDPEFWLNIDPYETHLAKMQKLIGEAATDLEVRLEPEPTSDK